MTDVEHARAVIAAVESLNMTLDQAARAGVQVTVHLHLCDGLGDHPVHPIVKLGQTYRVQIIDPGIGAGGRA